MKIDKGIVNLLTRSLRQNWQNSADFNNSVVLSLWSGTELDGNAIADIRDNYTWAATGKFQNHWPSEHQTPRGSVERARLVLHNFNDRYELKPFTYDFDFSKRSEAFSILSAGGIASFTLILVGTSWAGYTSATADEGRLLISGTVGLLGSGADLEISETNLSANSKIVASTIHLNLTFLNYETGTWSTESGTAALIDPYWHRVSFLANFNFSASEIKSGSGASILSGSESYVNSSFGVNSKALALDGNSVLSYPNYLLTTKSPTTGDFTYEVWCVPKMDGVSDVAGTLRAPWGYTTAAASNSSVYVYFNGVSRSLRVAIGATTVIAAIADAFLPNAINHIAIQRKSGRLQLFVNGWKLADVANTTNINLSTLKVGSSDLAANNFIGDIDAIRFTNSARYNRPFYFIDKQPSYYVDLPTVPNNAGTVSLIDFSVDPTKDLVTGLPLEYIGIVGTPSVTYENGYAVFNGSAGLATSKAGYGIGSVFTIETYFIMDAPHSGSGVVLGFGRAFHFGISFYANNLGVYYAYTYPNVIVAPDVRLNIENHLAIVCDGTNTRAYLNGKKIYDAAYVRTIPEADQIVSLGEMFTRSGYPFTGRIRSTRVSNVARYTDNFVPDGSFVEYNTFSVPEQVRIPKSDILETSTEGWTLIANAPSGLILNPADWSEALSKMTTGIKVIDASGRVGFLSKAMLRPTDQAEIQRTHRSPDTYTFQTGADSYIYHHEISGNNGQGLDYSYLFINRTDGLIWNNSSRWQFNALGQPQLPASIYIH